MGKAGGKRLEESEKAWGVTVRSVLKGSVLALLVTMTAALVCAALVSGGWMDLRGGLRAAPLLCVPGAVVGAFISGREQRVCAVGAASGTGLVLFALLAAVGCGLRGSLPDGTSLLPVLAACVGSGTVVGIVGRGKRKKKRRKHL